MLIDKHWVKPLPVDCYKPTVYPIDNNDISTFFIISEEVSSSLINDEHFLAHHLQINKQIRVKGLKIRPNHENY